MADNNTKIILTAVDETKAAFDTVNRNIESMSGGLLSLHGILGTVSAVGIAAMIKSSIDAADHLNDLRKSTDLTVEQLSGLKLASLQSGTDLDAVAKSVNKLSINMGLNAEKYAALGINSTDKLEAYKQFADVFNRIADVHQRDAFASAALGKNWQETAALLAEGGTAIGEMVNKGAKLSGVTQDMGDHSDHFNDRLAEMKMAFEGVSNRVTKNLLPTLNNVGAVLVDVATDADSMTQASDVLTGIINTLVSAGLGAAHVFSQIGTAIGSTAAAAVAAASGNFKEAATIWKQSNDDMAKSDEQFAARIDKLWNTVNKPKQKEATPQKGPAPDISGFLELGEEFKKLVEESKKADAEMVSSHEDAFSKTIGKWVEMENKLIAEGAKGTRAREAHEAAYTEFVNEESRKRLEDHKKHTEELTKKQQERFVVLRQQAEDADATDKERMNIKHKRELGELEKQRLEMIKDHDLSLEEIQRFEQAKADIDKRHLIEKQHSDGLEIQAMRAMFKFKRDMRMDDFTNAMDTLAKATSGMATHSRAAFEINKIATIASITAKAPGIIVDAYQSGMSEWGSWVGGVAYAAAATLAMAAQLSAANSATYGGGGSIAPALGGTAGTPASTAATQASTQPTASQSQPTQVNIYNTGNVLTPEYVQNTIFPQLKEHINNADMLLIDPRSRQATLLKS